MELHYRPVRTCNMLRLDQLRMDTRSACPREIQMEAFGERNLKFASHQFHTGIRISHLLQCLFPISLEVGRTGITSLIR